MRLTGGTEGDVKRHNPLTIRCIESVEEKGDDTVSIIELCVELQGTLHSVGEQTGVPILGSTASVPTRRVSLHQQIINYLSKIVKHTQKVGSPQQH